MTDVCLLCGVEGGRYDNMCEDCFRKKTRVSSLPSVLKMKVCLRCNYMVNPGSNQRIVEWHDGIREVTNEALELKEKATIGSLDVDFNERDDYLLDVAATVTSHLLGLKFHESHSLELRLDYGVCNRCSRMHGNYYEAIIQFRGGRRPPSDTELEKTNALVLKRASESESENGFISNVRSMHKGLDFYLGDKSLGRVIARELQHLFGGSFQESFSLAGKKDGKEVYRATYLVRLPEYRAGDFVNYGSDIYLLETVSERSVVIRNLVTGKRIALKEREKDDIKLLHGEVVEAVVVSISQGEAQILDPVSYRTVPVIPPVPLSSGETVSVFRFEERLYLVPDKKAD